MVMDQRVRVMKDLKVIFRVKVRTFILSLALVFGVGGVFATENDKTSLDKLINEIDEIVGGALDPNSFEARCSNDAKACGDEELCVRAINTINPSYKDEVKRRGMKCGGEIEKIETARLCSSETAYNCSEKELCSWASSGGEWRLSTSLQLYVEEAKRRGLTCGVKAEAVCEKNPAVCSEATLCKRATYKQGYVRCRLGVYK